MKKLFLSLCACIFVVSLVVGLVSCNTAPSEPTEPAHTHEFTIKNVEDKFLKSEASCKEAATYYYSCACGDKGSETFTVGSAKGHSHTVKNVDDKYLASEADCENAAKYYYSCTCGDKGSETFTVGSAKGHSYTEENTDGKYLASSASCGEAATYYYSCECGKAGAATFTSGSANGHNYVVKNTDAKYFASEADCENAAKYYYSCSCADKGSETFTVGSAKGHSYTEENTDAKYLASEADCENAATYYYSCACGDKGSETFTVGSAKGHSHTVKNVDDKYLASEADCENAAKYYYSCSCGDKGNDLFVSGNPLGHKEGEWIVDKEPTCKENGNKYYNCTVCGAKIDSMIEKLYTHTASPDWIIDKNSTCTEEGKKHIECLICGKTIIESTIPLEEHSIGDWILDSAATCQAAGSKHKECQACKQVQETEQIPQLDNCIPSDWIIDKEAHGEEDGLRHIECIMCKTVIVEEIIQAEVFVYWTDTKNLLIEINTNDWNGEFPEACTRYLAGNYGRDYPDDLDAAIAIRNENAERCTKTHVTYYYPPDSYNSGGQGWGANVNHFFEALTYEDGSRPDIFINYVYDLLSATLKGCFMNLYSTAKGEGENYFTFSTEPDAEDTGDGYMYEYMRTLTVSKTTMYLIASDYFIDVIRAMFVVPVNNGQLATLTLDNTVEGAEEILADRSGDDRFGISDIYQMVRDHEWTYEALAVLCDLFDRDTDGKTGDENQYSLSDKVGFVVSSSSGLSSSGLVYTIPFEIVSRKFYDVYPETGPLAGKLSMAEMENWGDFVYDYPETSAPLVEFCTALEKLFETNGVFAISRGKSDTMFFGADELIAISNAFAKGNVLFGGIVLLGSLETDTYYGMLKDDVDPEENGFGIVPMPLYKAPAKNDDGSFEFGYQTQIHNLARIGAICKSTKNFEACTAYLEYQSTHSTDILEKYYEYKIQYGIGQGTEGNIEMINLIRANVGSAFNKAMEDIIRVYYSQANGASLPAWHHILQNPDGDASTYDAFKAKDEIATAFEQMVDTKVDVLIAIHNIYINNENMDQ